MGITCAVSLLLEIDIVPVDAALAVPGAGHSDDAGVGGASIGTSAIEFVGNWKLINYFQIAICEQLALPSIVEFLWKYVVGDIRTM